MNFLLKSSQILTPVADDGRKMHAAGRLGWVFFLSKLKMAVWIVLQEPADSLQVERSTGLFDRDSVVFQNTLLLTSSLLISCLLLGIMHEIIRYSRSRAKIKPHGRIFESNSIMKLNYVSFYFPPWEHALGKAPNNIITSHDHDH